MILNGFLVLKSRFAQKAVEGDIQIKVIRVLCPVSKLEMIENSIIRLDFTIHWVSFINYRDNQCYWNTDELFRITCQEAQLSRADYSYTLWAISQSIIFDIKTRKKSLSRSFVLKRILFSRAALRIRDGIRFSLCFALHQGRGNII